MGSTNLDLWSFLRDDEVNAIVVGLKFAGKMEEMFSKDLEASNPIHLEQWEKRTVRERLHEWMWRIFAHWL